MNLFARLIHCLIGWLKHIAAPKRAADREQPPHSVTLRESQRDEEETRRELEEAPIDKQHDTVSSAETLTIATSEQHRTDEQPLISNGLDAVPTASLKSPDAPPTQLPSIEKTRDAGKHTPFDLDLEAPEQPAPDSQPTSKSAVADQPYTSNEAQSEPRDSRERPVRPPEKRGGRPRDPRSFDKEPRKTKDGVRASRPEIVCWKRGREWVVGVEMPDGISQSSNLVVVQASSSLAEDGSRPGCWPLAKLNTAVAVQIGDGSLNQTINIAMGDEDWLLFKLSGRNLDHGRKVKQASSGLYLAIVPKSWVRDAEEGGTAPTADEPVFLEGYRAHFFELIETTSSCIAFRNDRGDPIVIGSSGPQVNQVRRQGVAGHLDDGHLRFALAELRHEVEGRQFIGSLVQERAEFLDGLIVRQTQQGAQHPHLLACKVVDPSLRRPVGGKRLLGPGGVKLEFVGPELPGGRLPCRRGR